MHAAMVSGALIDTGPTVFTLKPIFDHLFARCDLEFDDYVTTSPLDLLARHNWADPKGPGHPDSPDNLDLFASVKQSIDAIHQFSGPKEAENYRQFTEQASKAFDMLDDRFMRRSAPNLLPLFKGLKIGGLLAANPFQTLWNKLGSRFDDPRLQQLFSRYATYCGSSPFSAPSTLMLVAHAEQKGVWAVQGGMDALARGLHKACERLGVVFHFNTGASSLIKKSGRIKGIILSNGAEVPAAAVIFGGDIAALSSGCFGESTRQTVPAPKPEDRSLSAMTWAMLAKTDGFDLAHHTLFFARNYADEFEAIFDRSSISSDPTIYICAQDRGPFPVKEGAEDRIFILINAPPNGDRQSYKKEDTDKCLSQIMTRLGRAGLSLTVRGDTPLVSTPADFSVRFPATGGALYGRANHGPFDSFKRPGVKTKMTGLYLAGGSTHPSPGVPMASLSGQMAAAEIISDWDSIKR